MTTPIEIGDQKNKHRCHSAFGGITPAGIISRRIFRCYQAHLPRSPWLRAVGPGAGNGGREEGVAASLDTSCVARITFLRLLGWSIPLPCLRWPFPPRFQLQLETGPFFATKSYYSSLSINVFLNDGCLVEDTKKPASVSGAGWLQKKNWFSKKLYLPTSPVEFFSA